MAAACQIWSRYATALRSMTVWCWWYSGPVVMGNVGDTSVSSCRFHAYETQQLSSIWMTVTDATPVYHLCSGHGGVTLNSPRWKIRFFRHGLFPDYLQQFAGKLLLGDRLAKKGTTWKNRIKARGSHLPVAGRLATHRSNTTTVLENTYFTFFSKNSKISKNVTFYIFFEMTSKSCKKKSLAKV